VLFYFSISLARIYLAKQDKVGRNKKGKEEYLLPEKQKVGAESISPYFYIQKNSKKKKISSSLHSDRTTNTLGRDSYPPICRSV
jgi:hypothetical protein